MMLRYSFDMDQEADDIEAAVRKVLEQGYRTPDIRSRISPDGEIPVGCKGMGDAIVAAL